MSKLQSFKRIIIEDFEEKDRTLVGKLASSINSFAEDVLNALTNNISIDDNMNFVKKDLTLTVDSNGRPTTKTTLKTGLKSVCVGTQVIRATNLTNTTTYATSQPLISFTDNSGVITIQQVSGLQANNKYQLKLILYV